MEEQTNTTKKYYWLKLQKDFFKRHDIRVIEAMPNGKDYILFYLKLLVESVSHEGRLRFSDTIPYNEDMLAVVTDTNVDIVRAALKVFVELGMIEKLEDSTLYMAEVEKMIGYETKWAEKKRIYRLSHPKAITQKEDNVLDMSAKCPSHVRQEKEIEKELELEKELEVKKKPTVKKKFADANEIAYPNDPVLDNAFRDYVLMRAEIKKPLTEHARDLQIKHLNELSGGDSDKAIKILEQSTRNCWSDLYAIKGSKSDIGKVNWDQV